MPEQINNVNGEVEILKKTQKEMLAIKNTATEMRNASDGLIQEQGRNLVSIRYCTTHET